MNFLCRSGLAIIVLSALGGCHCSSPSTQSFDVIVKLDNRIDEPVEVDVVAVNSELAGQKVGPWFRPDSGQTSKRAAFKPDEDRKTLRFEPGGEMTVTLSKGDKIWEGWLKNKTAILVFADLRDKNKDEEPVRVSLSCGDWDKGPWEARVISVSIKGPLVVVETLQKLPSR